MDARFRGNGKVGKWTSLVHWFHTVVTPEQAQGDD